MKDSENPSFHGCCAASLLVLSEHPLWIFAEDSGKYKEVDLGLRVSVDNEFGQEGHESLFLPSRMEVKDFPESCRLDRFLNEKPSMVSKTKSGEGRPLLEGLVLGNSKGDRLARMSHKFFRFCSEANDQRVSDQLGVFQPKFFSQIGKYDAAQSRFRIPFFSTACNIHGPLS